MPYPFVRWTGAALAGAIILATQPLHATERKRDLNEELVLSSEGFMAAHPDMRWRVEGLNAFEAGRHEDAAAYFRRAARFADKPAQAMLAEMLWDGRGVERNRAQAYAWMDLAAERHYRPFLIQRERYWNALDAGERERALEFGRSLYAEFGDDVAKPRLERLLTRAKRNVTGSRVGNVGALTIMVPGPGGQWERISGEEYYSDKLWVPEQYWAWQDRTWKEPGTGRVDVLPAERVPSPPAE